MVPKLRFAYLRLAAPCPARFSSQSPLPFTVSIRRHSHLWMVLLFGVTDCGFTTSSTVSIRSHHLFRRHTPNSQMTRPIIHSLRRTAVGTGLIVAFSAAASEFGGVRQIRFPAMNNAVALNNQAAALGHYDAILAAGWFYLQGRGVARDLKLAEYWYRRAARRGEPKAMFSLGYMAYEAQAFVIARRWFERASAVGHVRSLYWLGKLAWRGHGVRRDQKAAFTLFHRAARAHDPEAIRVLRFLSLRSATSNRAGSFKSRPPVQPCVRRKGNELLGASSKGSASSLSFRMPALVTARFHFCRPSVLRSRFPIPPPSAIH